MTGRDYVASVGGTPLTVTASELMDGDVLVGSQGTVWPVETAYILRGVGAHKFNLCKVETPGTAYSVNWNGGGIVWLVIRPPTANKWGEFAP